MRIVVWNCKMAFSRKSQLIRDLSPDIAIVPECSNTAMKECATNGIQCRWFGENPHKGLGVWVAKPWNIVRIAEPRNRWIAPIWISGPIHFLLVAVWAMRVQGSESRSYIGQVHEALTQNPQWFRGYPVIVAGDFNSNKIWDEDDAEGIHSTVVNLLEKRKLVSAYHSFFSELQGKETRDTHYFWHRKERGYHIDYVFLPRQWAKGIRRVEVGTHEEWSQISDHVPLTVEVELQ